MAEKKRVFVEILKILLVVAITGIVLLGLLMNNPVAHTLSGVVICFSILMSLCDILRKERVKAKNDG